MTTSGSTLTTGMSLSKSLTSLSVVVIEDNEELTAFSLMMIAHNSENLAQGLV